MRYPRPSTIAWCLYYLFLACLLAANSFGYLDPDFGWHLKFGEIIAQTKSVPHDQIFMWALAGKNWVDHEWLANLITYGLSLIGGYIGISLFFIAIPLLTIGTLNFYIFIKQLKHNRERVAFAALELLAIFSCLPHFGVRVQEFSFLFFALELLIIDSFKKTKNWKLLTWLIPLLFIWTCTHGGYLIGAALIFGWLIYEGTIILFPKLASYIKEEALSKKEYYTIISIGVLAITSTCLSPYGYALYNFLGDYGSNRYYLSHIEEWRSPLSSPFRYDQISYALIVITLALGSIFFTTKRPRLWQIGIASALLIASLRSVRHFPLWALGSLLYIAPIAIREILKNIRIPYSKIIGALITICLVVVSIALVLQTKFTNKPLVSYCSSYPCGAITFLEKNPNYKKLRLFNDYGWGGFIIGSNIKLPVFIDGRLPQYPYKNISILEEYSSFFKEGNTEKKLDEHGIGLIIFKAAEPPYEPDIVEKYILGKKYEEHKNPLLEFLKGSKKWKELYRDTVSVIYVKMDQK